MTLAIAFPSAHAANEARNVIVFIGNGLGPSTVTAARLMRSKQDGTLAVESEMTEPFTGFDDGVTENSGQWSGLPSRCRSDKAVF